MDYAPAHVARQRRVMDWFAPARFGLFYHWGLFTGGGCTNKLPAHRQSLTYPTPDAFEAAAGPPEAAARRMVDAAAAVGARYATLTALHSCGGYCVLYPTAVEAFPVHTRGDYLGAFVRAARERGIGPLLYIPADPAHHVFPGGPWLAPSARDHDGFAAALKRLVDELADRHGSAIAGFWIDGMGPAYRDLPAHIRARLPDAVVVNNNNTSLDLDDVDYGTTEFLVTVPEPAYCRPNALRRVQPTFSISIPGPDFNEDIPTCNGWWHKAGPPPPTAEPYLADRHFLLRQLLSSLGQRGQWNFALGIGPLVDGSLPPEFAPSLAAVADFLAWGGEAVYRTTGGMYGRIVPGYFSAPWSPEGFCSVTRSLDNPDTHYLLVTDAPAAPRAGFHTRGARPRRIADLRTGKELPFTMMSGIQLDGVDWSDVAEHGVKGFKVEF